MAGPGAAQSFEFKPNQRYPDPSVQILDPSFTKYRVYSATVEQLATGFRWAEGPVWFGDGRYLSCSGIPNQRILKWEEEIRRGQHQHAAHVIAHGQLEM